MASRNKEVVKRVAKRRAYAFLFVIIVATAICVVISIPHLKILESILTVANVTIDESYVEALRFCFAMVAGALLGALISLTQIFNRVLKTHYRKYENTIETAIDKFSRHIEGKLLEKFDEWKVDVLRKSYHDFIEAYAPDLGDEAVDELRLVLERLRGAIRENYRRIDEIEFGQREKPDLIKASTAVEYALKNTRSFNIPYAKPDEKLRCYMLCYDDAYEKREDFEKLHDEIRKGMKYFYTWRMKNISNIYKKSMLKYESALRDVLERILKEDSILIKDKHMLSTSDASLISSYIKDAIIDISIEVSGAIVNGQLRALEKMEVGSGIDLIEASKHHILLGMTKAIEVPPKKEVKIKYKISRTIIPPLRNYWIFIREITKDANVILKVKDESGKKYQIEPYAHMWSVNRPVTSVRESEAELNVNGIVFPYSTIHFSIRSVE